MGSGTGTGEQWLSFTAGGLGPQAFRARHSQTSGPVESWALQRQLRLLQRWRLDSLRGSIPRLKLAGRHWMEGLDVGQLLQGPQAAAGD